MSVSDRGDWPVKKSVDVEAICEAAAAVDEARLVLRKSSEDVRHAGSLLLVFGNSPDELIADCSAYNQDMDAICGDFDALGVVIGGLLA